MRPGGSRMVCGVVVVAVAPGFGVGGGGVEAGRVGGAAASVLSGFGR